MSTKNVSLKSIAAKVNVSINTVSHALRDMDDISEELKVKIRKTAIEMGYMPNHVVQVMKKDERPVIGVYVDAFTNLYFDIFYDEFIKVFQSKNEYNLVFVYSAKFDTDVIKQCILQRVDLILTYTECDEATAEFARMNAVRIAFAGNTTYSLDGADLVAIDNDLGCRLAARYLYNYHSGTRYMYVGIGNEFCRRRYAIFREELYKLNADTEVGYFNAWTEDIHRLYAIIKDGCRGLFFFNDMTAYEVLSKLDAIVINVRKIYPDLHLVGFDGLCEWMYGLRQITTIKIDFRELASKMYEVIATRLEQPDCPAQHVVLPVTLHQRRE